MVGPNQQWNHLRWFDNWKISDDWPMGQMFTDSVETVQEIVESVVESVAESVAE